MNTPDKWLGSIHGVWYENAEHDHKRDNLYFDPRAWTSKEIKHFFQDLKFGNVEVYEKCIEMYPRRRQFSAKNESSAKRRYEQWCSIQQ